MDLKNYTSGTRSAVKSTPRNDSIVDKYVTDKKLLFILGSRNISEMMLSIARFFPEEQTYFTHFYADGYVDSLAKAGMLDFCLLGGAFRRDQEEFIKENNLRVDRYGTDREYDLVVTGSDLIVPKNVRNKKLVLVQEGMTDPKNVVYYLVKWFGLPRYLASTSTNGLSDAYEAFCVASEGYKELFVKNGVNPEKIRVTGIPNFDNCVKYYDNDFPYKDFVLVATSDSRETFKIENRKKVIRQAVEIADGRQLIFKLHPNELKERATKEIEKYAPGALVYAEGNIHEMIANCETLICKYSTVVYTGIALGKECYSYFDMDELKKLTPIQNGGRSAENIAKVCMELLEDETIDSTYTPPRVRRLRDLQAAFKKINFDKTKYRFHRRVKTK